MSKFEISLTKRSSKVVLYFFAGIFILIILAVGFSAVRKEFNWFEAIVELLFLFGLIWVVKSLIEYYRNKSVKLIVEVNEGKIIFYNEGDNGKPFNKSESFKLEEMERLYVVKKRTRYFMYNFYFQFQGKSALSKFLKDDVKCFPSLFETDEAGRNQVLAFVKLQAPHIEIGYVNFWQQVSAAKK